MFQTLHASRRMLCNIYVLLLAVSKICYSLSCGLPGLRGLCHIWMVLLSPSKGRRQFKLTTCVVYVASRRSLDFSSLAHPVQLLGPQRNPAPPPHVVRCGAAFSETIEHSMTQKIHPASTVNKNIDQVTCGVGIGGGDKRQVQNTAGTLPEAQLKTVPRPYGARCAQRIQRINVIEHSDSHSRASADARMVNQECTIWAPVQHEPIHVRCRLGPL